MRSICLICCFLMTYGWLAAAEGMQADYQRLSKMINEGQFKEAY